MKTRILKVDPRNIEDDAILEAALAVEEGSVVAFPTETVYGLACKASSECLRRLDHVKKRAAGKHYTLHIGSPSALKRYVPHAGLRGDKLIANAWPGPLTIVFEMSAHDLSRQKKRLGEDVFSNLYGDHSLGVRCPDNPVATALLDACKCPVVAPSANLSGQPAAVSADEVASHFDGRIDLIVDGGKCRYKKSSTVVNLGSGGLDILRSGAYSKKQLEEMSTVRFLMVCTGNTCRSPMAEALFSKYLAEKTGCKVDRLEEFGYKVSSAGTLDLGGRMASDGAIAACQAMGIDLMRHRSTALTADLVEAGDFIYVMSRMHLREIQALFPHAADKCRLLAGDSEIADPIGQSQSVFNACAAEIADAVKKRIGELKL